MSEDFFDRLETELADRTRGGAHLGAARARQRRRLRLLLRRGTAIAALAAVMAASLVGEFPASAGGHVGAAGTVGAAGAAGAAGAVARPF